MKAQNEKEFKQLIKTYESITLEQLKEEDRESDFSYKCILSRLTGFDNTHGCTLCNATRRINPKRYKDCSVCVYAFLSENSFSCVNHDNEATYESIVIAKSLKSLLSAIQNRAKRMHEVWKLYLKQRS